MKFSDAELSALIGILDFVDTFSDTTVSPLPLDEYERKAHEKLKKEKKRRAEIEKRKGDCLG